MELKLLQAKNGDAIHLRFKDEEGESRNILIDGGTSEAYTYKDKNKKNKDGELKTTIEKIRDDGEFIDLLILTHIDDDHVGGILKWFGQDEQAKDLIKNVWFNSGRLIAEYFEQEENPDNQLIIDNDDSLNTSVKQGLAFEEFIETNKIWDKRILKSKDIIKKFGLKFTILAPSETKLQALLTKWEKEAPTLETSAVTDYTKSLSELIESDVFKEDTSIPNGSCIAFLLEQQGKSILFLGDTHPQSVIDSLIDLGYSPNNPLKVDFVKVSHHGSKSNTNAELLSLIQSENFLISSNGDKHQLPDKRCLARIIKHKDAPTFYFNYPEMIDEIFTKQDRELFPNFTTNEATDYIQV